MGGGGERPYHDIQSMAPVPHPGDLLGQAASGFAEASVVEMNMELIEAFAVLRRALTVLLVPGLVSLPISAVAATPAQLFALRDAAVTEACVPPGDPGLGPIVEAPLGAEGRLHIVPCRSTFADVMSVVVLARAGTLRALYFPEPGATFDAAGQGARMDRLGVTALLSSPRVAADGALVASARIAPGMGNGYLVQYYVLDDGQPVLTRFAIERDGHAPIVLWSAP